MSEEKYEVRIRPEKEAIVAEMKEKLASQGVVLVSFNKLDVKNATLLRRKFLAHGVEYKVIKNTLTRIAADELGLEGLDDLLAGPNGLATCKDDPVAPAAALKEFFFSLSILLYYIFPKLYYKCKIMSMNICA